MKWEGRRLWVQRMGREVEGRTREERGGKESCCKSFGDCRIARGGGG